MSQTLDSKTDTVFAYRREQLEEMARDVLRVARELGATDAATEISEGQGLSVTVRKGEIETIEQNREKIVGVRVMRGKKRGNASTSDFSPAALRSTVEAAKNTARFTADD
ncbi:metalloprotease PmbA, partial [Pandoraea nosoerga]|uniref:PmbA/TldA family metallopeptidase n=1 Tax=Pandoraea nosoerga TaxID=2508296 RepID=UPI002402D8F9